MPLHAMAATACIAAQLQRKSLCRPVELRHGLLGRRHVHAGRWALRAGLRGPPATFASETRCQQLHAGLTAHAGDAEEHGCSVHVRQVATLTSLVRLFFASR